MNLQKTLRAIALAALFIVPIFALIIANSYFFPFITGKAFYFRILVEVGFTCWIILAFLDAKYRPKFTPLTITVTLFAVVTLLANLLGVNPMRSLMSNFERMEGWLVGIHLWAFYMTATHIFGPGETGKRLWHRWFNTSLVVASVIGLYAIAQLVGSLEWFHAHMPGISAWFGKTFPVHQGSTRIDASLGNSAYLAVYLLMHIGMAMYLFFVARARAIAGSRFLQWAYPILALIFAFFILQTQTRGTMIGLALGLAVACVCQALYASGTTYKKTLIALSYPLILALYALFVLILDSFSMSLWYLYWIGVAYLIGLVVYVALNSAAVQNKAIRIGRWISVGILALAFIAIGVFFLIKDASFIRNSPSLNRIASISLTDTKTQARAYIWPMALKGFTQRPILGWGQENFNYIFNANYNPKMWNQEQWFDRAHSVYLDWLVASGAVGLIVYLALYVFLLLAVWKSSVTISEKSVLTGLIVGYGIHNIFVFDNLASYVFFFAMLGFAGSLAVPAVNTKKQARAFSLDAVEYIVMPVSIIALLAGLYFLNIRPIQANTRLIGALTACSSRTILPGPESFNKALFVSAMANQEIREQILSCAGNIISRQYPGPTKQAFYDLALKAIKDQTDSTPRDARMYVLGGMFLSGANQIAEALPVLEKAHELTPNKQTVSIQLATAYINVNKNDEALKLLKTAYEADPTFGDAQGAYVVGLVLTKHDDQARLIAASSTQLFENERVARAYASIHSYDKAIDMFKRLLAQDPKSLQLRVELAQVYVAANMKWAGIEVMRSIAKDFPEYKDQVDAAIKEIQNAKPVASASASI